MAFYLCYLCSGDAELLKDIAERKLTTYSRLNDSQRRSARYLYNQELVELRGEAPDSIEITLLGRERLSQVTPD